MKIIELGNSPERPLPCVATIGFFDGVHLGHRYIIDKVMETSRQRQMASAVVTFARHPRQVLQPGWHPQLLSTLDEKTALLSATGIDQLVVLPFDGEMARLSARDFMAQVLRRQLGVTILVTGYDNHFGHRTAGVAEGFDDYVGYGRELGMTVVRGDAFDADTIRVSSSKVRLMLHNGDVELAALCLGRPYELSGRVVSGDHIGTGMGFPTANMQPSYADKLIPGLGAYAVKVCVDGEPELHGMMNIGRRPTFDGDHLTLETNIFHFDGNLYGRQMTVRFISRLRPELKFNSSEALAAQLVEDSRRAEEILNKKIV